MKKFVFLSLCFSILFFASAQKPHQASAAEIFQKMEKLNVLGNVLYLAAHPDDENTRFIAYCAQEKLFNTAYLSLTRGSGGQNLIGPEIRDALGVIRTQELLAARKIDGGSQFFARANDFGYSKTAEESFQIWDKDKLLSDVVFVIRQFRPDVIVLRFPPDERAGHGHHTASALLGLEGFDVAADKKAFPAFGLAPWQATRIVTNSGRWWNPNISANDSGVVALNIGEYSALLGLSINEISAHSRSQHKSQGFGTAATRGEEMEYFTHHKGVEAKNELFEGVNTSWSRVAGGEKVETLVNDLLATFKVNQPAQSIDKLLKIREVLATLNDDFWKEKKLAEVNQLIKDCSGLFLEAVASEASTTAGDSVTVNYELVNRSNAKVNLKSISFLNDRSTWAVDTILKTNQSISLTNKYALPKELQVTQPYWLKEEGSLGMYEVKDKADIGKAEADPTVLITMQVTIQEADLEYTIPLVYKTTDPAKGELYSPFVVTPAVFVNFKEPIYMFPSKTTQTIDCVVKTGVANFQGDVTITAPKGWQLEQTTWKINLAKKGEEQLLKLKLTPTKKPTNGKLLVSVRGVNKTTNQSIVNINYDHIPPQVFFPKAATNVVFIDLKKTDIKIGYIEGAGDVVPQSLRTIGYEVELLSETDLQPENLAQYHTIMLGIRALNTLDRIEFMLPKLHKFVENGGTLIYQYNTNHRLKTEEFAPYTLKLSKDRVTEENTEVTFLAPEHPVLNYPNKITKADFENWVQERGLYFPNEWSAEYQPILRWHDQGETNKDGALLVANYGKGHIVYTGISFFRELPAGVPGAFRLLVNLIEY